MPTVTSAGALVGRDSELAMLVRSIRGLAEGGAVLSDSEPGIAKSSLVRAAISEMADVGCQVFWGAGDELGQALPLLPLLDALRVREPSANQEETRWQPPDLARPDHHCGAATAPPYTGIDLPIAIAVLTVAGTVPAGPAAPCLLIADLGVDGSLRPVQDVLPTVTPPARAGLAVAIVAPVDAAEAVLMPGVSAGPASWICAVVTSLSRWP